MTDKFAHGYALLIGVGESAYPKWSLPVTVKDMQALRAVLTDPALCGYPDDDAHIRLLHDAGATRQAILDGLAWLAEQAAADSEATAVVFYSGHGWVADGSGKLLPAAARCGAVRPGGQRAAGRGLHRRAAAGAGRSGCWSSWIAATRRAWPQPKMRRP